MANLISSGPIGNEWALYRTNVISAEAPEIQITESRRAFYAGAWAFYQLLMNQLEPDHEPTAADLQLMKELDAELRKFAANVKSGRA